jgi:hypothetical protein
MTNPESQASSQSGQRQAGPAATETPGAATGTTTTTKRDRRVVYRRPSLLWTLAATLFDLIFTGLALLLITWAPLRDGLFALQARQGSQTRSAPLLAPGFVNTAVPVLAGVILFAFLIRLLTRIAGVRGWTLALGLLVRLLGGAAIAYLALQRVIFSIDPAVKAPVGPGNLYAFADFWGRIALYVSLGFVAIGVIDQLIAMGRHSRRQRAAAAAVSK